ncbi:hypothetical protein [Nonomuraea africana]|uniref:Uncharacterized protein n=1 Tax=Nonomuraea africana TaxID=46171 RepID=A0ABR9KE67_9ACTN|nr:hypothetical protein [Nonomuraea africana]MBE1560318.1 hypothetical protein [Nonomuraea africana]
MAEQGKKPVAKSGKAKKATIKATRAAKNAKNTKRESTTKPEAE